MFLCFDDVVVVKMRLLKEDAEKGQATDRGSR